MSSKLKIIFTMFAGSAVVLAVFLNPTQKNHHHHAVPALEKMHSSVSVKLRTQDELPYSETEPVVVIATIQSRMEQDTVANFEWALPDGARVLEGDLAASGLVLPAGQSVDVALKIIGFAKEEFKTIALSAQIDESGTLIGNSAVMTSKPEESFEMLSSNIATGVVSRGTASEGSRKRPLLEGPIYR